MAETLGSYLREQRLQRGLTLEAIASETRVPLQYLQGLEDDDLSKLPSAIVLAKAYLRSYVRCLRLSAAVEDHAMAYLADAMVAARDERQPAVPEARRSVVTSVIDLYYGILVTWTLARQRCFQTLSHQSWLLGQAARAVVMGILLWAARAMQAAAVGSAYAGRLLGSRIGSVCQTAAQALRTGVARYFERAVPPARALSREAITFVTSWSEPLRARIATARETAVRLATVLLRRVGRVGRALVTTAVAGVRAGLLRVGSGLTDAAQASTASCLTGGQRTVRLIVLPLGRLSAVLSSSVTSVLYVASLLTSISILWLITLTRGVSRMGTRMLDSAGQLYEFVRHSTYLSETVASVGMDHFRPTYLTAALMPGSQPRSDEPREGLAVSGQFTFHDSYTRERVKMGAWDMRAWYWVANYIVALLLAFVLASILGDAPLFRNTMLGETPLNASRLVQFIGFGTALLLFWFLGVRVAAQIPDAPLLSAIIRRLMTPLVTLVSLSGLYKILLLLGDPFLTKGGRQLYDWSFVILIMASAAWVTMAAFWMVHNARETAEMPTDRDLQPVRPTGVCPHCHTPVDSQMRFCSSCGSTLTTR